MLPTWDQESTSTIASPLQHAFYLFPQLLHFFFETTSPFLSNTFVCDNVAAGAHASLVTAESSGTFLGAAAGEGTRRRPRRPLLRHREQQHTCIPGKDRR